MTCPACRAENDASALTCAQCGAELLVATEVAPPPTNVIVTVNLAPGTVFAGRFEIVRPLGRGGMGIVYLARDRRLDDEVVAIKLLRPDFAQDPTMAARFKSEIKLARRVRHKNVGAIHDFDEDSGLLYISMEYVDGVDLKQYLRRHGAISAPEGYELAIQVTEGLQAVHDAGIIHRDLKTPNIMIDAKRMARLMDFGIAKQHGEGATTGSGHIVGTPEYMSPEQAQGKKVDFRSDIYALGIVIYEIFTGKVPFRGDTPIATILKHIQEPPTLEGPEAPPLPPTLIPVLNKCLAKDPAQRYASAHELVDALRRARSPSRKQELVSTAVLQAPTLRRSTAGSRRLFGPIAAVAIAAIALAVGWLAASRPVPEPPPAVPLPPTPRVTATVGLATAAPAIEERTLPPVAPGTATAAAVAPSAAQTPKPTATLRSTPAPVVRTASPSPLPPTPPPVATTAPPAVEPPAGGTGWLQVAVKPWAIVFLDGKREGETPLDKMALAAGRHQVVLERPGYEPYSVTVLIRAGQTEKLRFDFETQGTPKK
jgi:serine/threonine-protein kinase